MDTRIERASEADRVSIVALVSQSGLPIDGLADHLDTAVVACRGDRVAACAALEIYPDGALLRSVAVAPEARGEGLGQQIVRAALDLARQEGTAAVYLLTTTAEGFFLRFGFRRVSRDDVPGGVRTSIEFRSACPASATAMALSLSP
jgi:amino-acid N-acetyltransferase